VTEIRHRRISVIDLVATARMPGLQQRQLWPAPTWKAFF
jgi:hypothetical protein